MKLKGKFLCLGVAALATGLLASCSNELNEPMQDSQLAGALKLVKNPDVIAYSGEHVLGSTFGTGAMNLPAMYSNGYDGATGDQIWDQFKIPKNITDAEREKVKAAIEAKCTGERISEDLVLDWENYFLQDVISATETDTPSKSYSFEAYNKGAECNQKYWPGNDYENYEEVTNNGQISHYYQDRTTNPQTRIDKTALMYGMNNDGCEPGKQFRWFINCHENLHWYEYIFVEVDGNYYICFDFACGHKENDVDGNAGRGNTQNDWDYNDWVIKITKAVPVNSEENDICDNCEHESHGEICPKCQENGEGGCYVAPEKPETPDDSLMDKFKNDHVEINLSIEEREDVEWLASHLSIHVRTATDVEVFIPLLAKYYCQVDDMAIVQKHAEDLVVHGGPKTTNFTLGGFDVQLTVAFENDGIRVTTQGITQEVIDYCQETYGDGITFEVWNYMNLKVKDWSDPNKAQGEDILGFGQENQITVGELRNNLNNSKVWFKGPKIPSLYVNAFMYEPGCEEEEHTCDRFIDDCTVTPQDYYPYQEDGYWYNGSPYNQLYYDKVASEE